MLVVAETVSRRSSKAAALLLLTHSQIVPRWHALTPAKLIHNAHPGLRAIQVEACWLAHRELGSGFSRSGIRFALNSALPALMAIRIDRVAIEMTFAPQALGACRTLGNIT